MKYLILILLMFVSVGADAADFRMSLYNAKEPYEIENIILENENATRKCDIIEEEFLRRLKTDYVWREDNQVDNLAYLGRNLCYFSGNVKDALNDLVFKYYSDVCNGKGKNAPKTEYINHCIKYPTLCSLDYSISDGMKFLLDMTAFSNKNDDFYICVLSVVATWDFENAQEKNNLLDYGLERAKHYNNVQFENIINQLKQEIVKLQNKGN